MATLEFDATLFDAQFPQFASNVLAPTYWQMATAYISSTEVFPFQGAPLALALNMMTAHMLAIQANLAAGQATGVMTAASIDKVSVSIQPPPAANAFRYWLNSTPYGQSLLALLEVQSAGGWYAGAAPERAGFRKAGGVF